MIVSVSWRCFSTVQVTGTSAAYVQGPSPHHSSLLETTKLTIHQFGTRTNPQEWANLANYDSCEMGVRRMDSDNQWGAR